jgi:hypothetical protein
MYKFQWFYPPQNSNKFTPMPPISLKLFSRSLVSNITLPNKWLHVGQVCEQYPLIHKNGTQIEDLGFVRRDSYSGKQT